jgi:hypothetical protein
MRRFALPCTWPSAYPCFAPDGCFLLQEQATSSQQASKVAAVEKLKHNLRQYGALQRLGKLAAAAAQDAGTEARELHMLLLVLENATFTCQANGSALVQLQVAVPAADGKEQQQLFPAVLVSAAQQLLGQRADSECRQALHVCLSVLMNLSHQNPEGSAVISDAGGLAAAAATIAQLLGHAGKHSHQALCKQVGACSMLHGCVCLAAHASTS